MSLVSLRCPKRDVVERRRVAGKAAAQYPMVFGLDGVYHIDWLPPSTACGVDWTGIEPSDLGGTTYSEANSALGGAMIG
jgi:hypothetical protein